MRTHGTLSGNAKWPQSVLEHAAPHALMASQLLSLTCFDMGNHCERELVVHEPLDQRERELAILPFCGFSVCSAIFILPTCHIIIIIIMMSSPATSTITIQEEASSPAAIHVIPFAVRLPTSVFQSTAEEASSLTMIQNPQLAALLLETGIVGTITVLRKSVLIWFGWGKLQIGGSAASNGA